MNRDILSTTLRKIVDHERDLLFRTVPFLDAAQRLGGVSDDASGSSYNVPVVSDDHAEITEFTGSGYQAYSAANQESLQNLSYQYAMAGTSARISTKERLHNMKPGMEQRVELASQRIRQVRAKFGRSFEQQILRGDVTTLTKWNTLNGGFNSGSSRPNGFMYAGATPTDGGTVGGLARSVAEGLQNMRESQGSGELSDAITLADNEAQAFSEEGPVRSLFMLPEYLAELEAEAKDLTRYVDPDAIDSGVKVASFRGARCYSTKFMPPVSPSTVKVYGPNFDGIKLVFHKGADFRFRRWERIPGTEQELASILLSGQLVAHHLASSFVVVA